MEHAQVVEWPEMHPEAPEWAVLGGHGTSDYGTFMAFLEALDSGRKPVLDEVRAWDFTVPGLIAAESATRHGQWMEVPEAPRGDLVVGRRPAFPRRGNDRPALSE